jgi:CBS domain-containing protein
MMIDDTLMFLKQTPPFSFVDDMALVNIIKEISVAFHPRGQIILRQNGPAAEHLAIIRTGAAKVFVTTKEGEEVLVDSRTEGDFFGMRSFLLGEISLDTIVASEDTSVYLVPKDTVLGLLKTNAEFSAFCLQSILKRLMHMAYKEMNDRTLLYGGGDKLLFTNLLGDLSTQKVVTASEDVSIRQAAEIMSNHGISSLVLLDDRGLPSGVITDKDLRNKVVSRGRDVAGRVGDIMSVTLIKAEVRDYCYEALLKMMKYNIHHLLVVGNGELKGILTSHDLMMLQGMSPLSLAREIEHQDTIDGLVFAASKINRIITLLIKEGAKASTIARIITEINDRLLKKVLGIIENRMGAPPVSYCWIIFGSEGRKEQTFKTDQDNAIIYDDKAAGAKDAAEYFPEFALQMQQALARCGFPPCSAGYMASNPMWCQPLSVWKKYFSNWIHVPTADAILRSLIFFDFRPVHGNTLLAEQLRAFLVHEIKDETPFFAHLANALVSKRPPLDFFGKIECEKKGVHKGKFDIKISGLSPIIDTARFSALELQTFQTSTVERLAEMKDRSCMAAEFSVDLEQAFEFLMSLRLRHQYEQIREGSQPDNFINPQCLSMMEKTVLKESFKLIATVQESIRRKYGSLLE